MPAPATVIPLRLLPPTAQLTRSAPRPNLLTHHCEIVETGDESWRFKNRASA